MNCEYCQSPVHIWFQCPKKPDGWKPARLAKVRIGTASSPDRLQTPKSDVSASPPSDVKVHTQSPARLAKKSTAEKLGSPDARHEALGNVAGVTQVAGSGVSPPVTRQAGSKALPVDTNSEAPHCGDADPQRSGPATRKDAGASAQKPTKFDKKAWMRKNMPAYMRQYREDVKSGKRTPKPRA